MANRSRPGQVIAWVAFLDRFDLLKLSVVILDRLYIAERALNQAYDVVDYWVIQLLNYLSVCKRLEMDSVREADL